jgi:Family of unknown function (DUF5946)
MDVTTCPGCGLELENRGFTERMNASAACWELYGELSAYTLARGRDFIHQHGVDAYQAQHAVRGRIGVAFSLIGLCLAIERGATGLQVQRAHMHLAKIKRDWPQFELPAHRATLTVRDVLNANEGEARDNVLITWCASVWQTWEHAHAWTRRACDELLAESFSRRVRSR